MKIIIAITLNIIGILLLLSGAILMLLGFASDSLIIIGVTSLLVGSIVLRFTNKQHQKCCNIEEKVRLK
jgi:hypothetical protein